VHLEEALMEAVHLLSAFSLPELVIAGMCMMLGAAAVLVLSAVIREHRAVADRADGGGVGPALASPDHRAH
jgi:hypothetical protein